jgi:hypothetical protein
VVSFQPRPLKPGRTKTGAPCPCREMNYVYLFPSPYYPQKMTLETAHFVQNHKGKYDKRVKRPKILNTLKNELDHVNLKLLMAINMKTAVLWDVPPCCLGDRYQNFRGPLAFISSFT